MKTIILFSQFLSAFFLMSQNGCQSEYSNDARIFVEGKVVSSNAEGVQIKLSSGDIQISETKSLSDGTFKLGGPGTTGGKTLSFDRKIKSFSSNDAECRLSYDSLVLILPNKTYFKFAQISLEP